MATKKKVVKKVVAEKKVPAPTPKKEKKEKIAGKPAKSTVELISFGIKATIPVMVFGNIQPEIVVKAKTVEEAQAYALPIIEKLFETYCENPRDGSPKPGFLSKANVTVTEKNVPQKPAVAGPQSAPAGATAQAPKEEPKNIAQEIADAPERTEADLPPAEPAPQFAKSPALAKAENAVAAAMSRAALDMIENQVQESTKLTPEEKPMVYTLILKKRKEFE